MSATATEGSFDAVDVIIAGSVAALAQLVFIGLFSMPSPELVKADISNDNAQPIAVAITPVLKLGSKTPTSKLPTQWQRQRPVAAKSPPAPLPSPQAEKTPQAIPTRSVPDASVAPVESVDAGRTAPDLMAPPDAGATSPVASTEGSEQGAVNGTEMDPLKARAADLYRAQIAQWFMSRFDIRGKIPFDTLKTLHATATVEITDDRKVGSYRITRPSGDALFDGEVEATLSRAQSSGAELPAPPPMYPEMLGKTQSLRFQCNVQRLCE